MQERCKDANALAINVFRRRAIDLVDFWPPQDVVTAMQACGFTAVTAERRHVHYEQDLRDWLNVLRRRHTCSQLMAITETSYAAGLRRLQQELADGGAPPVRLDHLCLVTIRGEKPIGFPQR